MLIDWYKNNGYEVSSLITQQKIDATEGVVKQSYLAPLGSVADESVTEEVVGALTMCYLLQDNAKVTRAGAKVKTTLNSTNAYGDQWSIVRKRAVMALEQYAIACGKQSLSEVNDVCDLLFKKQFFYE